MSGAGIVCRHEGRVELAGRAGIVFLRFNLSD